MTRLSVLKFQHSQRLPVGYQHYGQLMIEKFIFDIFYLKKLVNSTLSQSWLQMSIRSAIMNIYAKYLSGGTRLRWRRWNELRNRRNKQKKTWTSSESLLLTKNRKDITYNKIRQANLVQALSKEERVEGSKGRTFFHCNTFVKEKNGVSYKPATLTYFQRSVQRQLNPKDSTVNLQKEDGFKLLNFLERF